MVLFLILLLWNRATKHQETCKNVNWKLAVNFISLIIQLLIGYMVLSGLARLMVIPLIEAKTETQSLRSILSHFNSTRNVNIDPAAKQRARDFIVETFKDHGLHTWTEEFRSNNEKVKTKFTAFLKNAKTNVNRRRKFLILCCRANEILRDLI